MVQLKLQNRKTAILKLGRATSDRLAILLDEIRMAVAWSRPSILLAVHPSIHGQERVVAALEEMLKDLSLDVVRIMPVRNRSLLLESILQRFKPEKDIFFVQGLSTHKDVFDELNLHREKIVENRLKLIFWLTKEEVVALSHRAPDFWAFRHTVVEFPPGRASRNHVLPSGVLVWQVDDSPLPFDSLDEKIFSWEKKLRSPSRAGETILAHAEGTGDLARLYWYKGATQKAENLLRQELEHIRRFKLNEAKALLCNGLAICCYDRGEYREALRRVEEALEAQPNGGYLWTNHGVVCRAAGRGEKSLSSVNKAIRIDPLSSVHRGILGYIFMSMGKFGDALASFETALRSRPESIPFGLALAVCHLRIGDMDAFETTMRRIPSDEAADDPYLTVCREGLRGNAPAALKRLAQFVKDEKIPSVFVRRDPSLFFIFGADALESYHAQMTSP